MKYILFIRIVWCYLTFLIFEIRYEVEIARAKIKKMAIDNNFTPPCHIISSIKESITESSVPSMSTDASMSRNISRWRGEGKSQPKSRVEIDLTEEQKLDKRGKKRFLLSDSSDERRILIFATDDNILVQTIKKSIHRI